MTDRSARSRKLLTGVLALASLGVVLIACGDDDFVDIPLQDLEGTSPTDEGNGRPKKKTAEDEADGGAGWVYSDRNKKPLPADPEGECKNAPTLQDPALGFACDFIRGGGSCQADETCCNPGVPKVEPGAPKEYAISFCAKTPPVEKGKSYPSDACKAQAPADKWGWVEQGASSWECSDSSHCGEGQECCLGSVSTEEGKTVNIGPYTVAADKPYPIPPSCKALQAYKNTGTHCAAKCEKPEIRLCSSDAQCPEGKSCFPFHAFQSFQKTFGYCN